MTTSSKIFKIMITSFCLLAFLLNGGTIIEGYNTLSNHPFANYPTLSSLTPHAPIAIYSDADFLAFPGNGTAEDPYLIEGYNITTTALAGIVVADTTKYFIIQNCYLEADNSGITIDSVAAGTAVIENNTCNNNANGIVLFGSSSATIVNNTCCNNTNTGIYLDSFGGVTINNNTCNDNGNEGIWLEDSNNCDVTFNTCNNNSDGISLWSSSGVSILHNTCNDNKDGAGIAIYSNSPNCIVNLNICGNNYDGIYFDDSDNSVAYNNTCSDNSKTGIVIAFSNYISSANNTCKNNDNGIIGFDSSLCNITYNLMEVNTDVGLWLFGSSNFTIHHNCFVNNNIGGCQASDEDGAYNVWYDQVDLHGNWWNDWSGTGTYPIDGNTGSVDIYPLEYNPVISEFTISSWTYLLLGVLIFISIPIIYKKN